MLTPTRKHDQIQIRQSSWNVSVYKKPTHRDLWQKILSYRLGTVYDIRSKSTSMTYISHLGLPMFCSKLSCFWVAFPSCFCSGWRSCWCDCRFSLYPVRHCPAFFFSSVLSPSFRTVFVNGIKLLAYQRQAKSPSSRLQRTKQVLRKSEPVKCTC